MHDWPVMGEGQFGGQARMDEQARSGEQARTAWLILGSSQDIARVDADRLAELGICLFRRRSGGGAVLLKPGSQVWIDVLIPRDDNLWQDDLSKSSLWLGEIWCGVLAQAGFSAEVHPGPHAAGRWGALACYLSRAAGEVLVDGRKCVGISQRRDKQGARFQMSLVCHSDAGEFASLFRLSESERRELELELEQGVLPLAGATTLGADDLAGDLAGCFLETIADI